MGADKLDEYLRMPERFNQATVYKFVKAITFIYGERYLHKLTTNDVHQLYIVHENKHGLLGILGSIDYNH